MPDSADDGRAGDLMSSGRPPAGPPGPSRARRLWRRRDVRAAAAVLAGLTAAVLLRSTVDPQARPVPTPAVPVAASPAPRFDRLPGRTPIPEPAQTGDRLSGPLPRVGGPDRAAANRAAALVLGRYCADQSRFSVELLPYDDGRTEDFRHLDALVTDRLFTDSGPAMQLTLDWDGKAYRWYGPLTLRTGC